MTISPLMPVYDRADIYFERGEGVYLFDDKGERYLDFVAGIAVTGLGHCHPALVAALRKQSETLWATSNIFKTHGGDRLAQRLVDLTFADTVFFQNSGAEAWECGVKTIRKYFTATKQPQRFRIIGFKGCFHGRTMTAIAASKAPKMVDGFGPLIDGFDLAEWDNLDSVRALITDQTAAIMIEPVMGEGGMKVASPAFLKSLRALCDQHGLLLYFDEIQCGMSRTGKLFAHEHVGVTPDVMCIAKALGNGFPIGACLATERAAQGMTIGTHGSTYGGNPLATAAGNAVLDVMTAPGFLDEVVARGAYLQRALDKIVAAHPRIFVGQRGTGLIRGLVCVPPARDVNRAFRAQKFLAVEAAENVIRLLPPLIVTEAEIDEAAELIGRASTQLENAA
ncbi:MAG: aspartate aminotransferase family protein [Alphaproteobacteria bacterium]|nr:aspartate aminotransferase family protein [Alphaproteobacteria bacterium]